uniref:Uncharacterized protein n=1 Tax=Nelumbo nucifera TaxID=4432 RepID=A0A822YKL9_NELNU|nr:TPA_asm: hypothetical protein HUJ06_011991 [Nelumbo nucifera]
MNICTGRNNTKASSKPSLSAILKLIMSGSNDDGLLPLKSPPYLLYVFLLTPCYWWRKVALAPEM